MEFRPVGRKAEESRVESQCGENVARGTGSLRASPSTLTEAGPYLTGGKDARKGDAHAPERRGCKRSREKGLQTLKRRRNGEEHVQALCALGNHLKRGDGESEGGKGDRVMKVIGILVVLGCYGE